MSIVSFFVLESNVDSVWRPSCGLQDHLNTVELLRGNPKLDGQLGERAHAWNHNSLILCTSDIQSNVIQMSDADITGCAIPQCMTQTNIGCNAHPMTTALIHVSTVRQLTRGTCVTGVAQTHSWRSADAVVVAIVWWTNWLAFWNVFPGAVHASCRVATVNNTVASVASDFANVVICVSSTAINQSMWEVCAWVWFVTAFLQFTETTNPALVTLANIWRSARSS